MSKIVVDTNVLVAYFKGLQPASDVVAGGLRRGEVMFSAVVVSEFLVGVRKKVDKKGLELLVEEFGVVPVDWKIAVVAAELRRRVLRKKRRVLLLDCFVAATARVMNAKLVTFDKKDYLFNDVNVEVLVGRKK